MDRYAKENAIRVIDGYYLPKAYEKNEVAFVHAKTEAIEKLEQVINHIKLIHFTDFIKGK